jgi:Meckel syndrome type 1 protein
MRRPARDTEIHREVTDHGNVLRDPLPTARAILWKPLPDSYHLLASMMRTTEQQAFLFITQRAFLQVERHLRSAPDLELGGFLAGQLFECPRTHARYSVINTVVPFADVSSDALLARVTQESFDAVRRRLDAHRLSLIGWYRNGAGLGLQLLPDDVETHLTYFDQPWQTTMLVMPDPAKPKGAFFTYDSRVGRSYCIPFYELFDSPGLDSKRLDRTCVSWTTYVAAEPVAPLPVAEKEVVEATITPPRKPTPEPAPKEPIDEWWEAIKDPWVKLKDVAASATRGEEGSSRVAEPVRESAPVRPLKMDPPRKAPTPVREPRVPDDRAPLIPPFIVPRPTRSQSAAAQPVVIEPAPVQPPTPKPTSVQRERPAPAAPRPAAPVGAPRKRPSPPLMMPTTPVTAANGPAVALPPDFHEEARRWQRRRRIGLAVAGVSFLSVIALSTLPSRTSRGAPPAAPAAAQAVTSAGLTVAMNETSAPVEIPLAAAVDSLSGALAYYRDIAKDHREGLVGCRVLDRAYALVGRARTRVDSARHQIAGSLADADSIRVSMLGAEYTFVTQTYRRSGCPA